MHNVECCENVYRGSSLPLIIAWNDEEIKKFMRWLKKQGNVNSKKVISVLTSFMLLLLY